jgi:hypothetical protein
MVYLVKDGEPIMLIGAATESVNPPNNCDNSPANEIKGVRFIEFQNLLTGLDMVDDFSVGGTYFYTSNGLALGGMEENYCHLKFDEPTNQVIAVTDVVDWRDDVKNLGIISYDIDNPSTVVLRMYDYANGLTSFPRYHELSEANIEPIDNGNFVISVKYDLILYTANNGYRGMATVELDPNDLNNTYGRLIYVDVDGVANHYGLHSQSKYSSSALATKGNSVFVSIGSNATATSVGNHVYLYSRDATLNRGAGIQGRECSYRDELYIEELCLGTLLPVLDETGTPIAGGGTLSGSETAVHGDIILCDGTFSGISFREKNSQKMQIEAAVSEVTIYPNPANESFKIEGLADIDLDKNNYNLTILNQNGSEVLQTRLTSTNLNNIELKDLNSGVYILRITSPESSTVKKLMIAR